MAKTVRERVDRFCMGRTIFAWVGPSLVPRFSNNVGAGKRAWWLLLCTCAKSLRKISRICWIFHTLRRFVTSHTIRRYLATNTVQRVQRKFSILHFLSLQRLLVFLCRQCWLNFADKKITKSSEEGLYRKASAHTVYLWRFDVAVWQWMRVHVVRMIPQRPSLTR